MIEVCRVTLATARAAPELADLLFEHYEELCQFKDLAGVDTSIEPDWSRYQVLEERGALIALLAYEGSVVVGYSASFLQTNLHYPGITFAQNDVLFIAKPHRHGRAGLLLIRETKRWAHFLGASLMLWHTKPGSTLETLMPRLGCSVLDTVWSERL